MRKRKRSSRRPPVSFLGALALIPQCTYVCLFLSGDDGGWGWEGGGREKEDNVAGAGAAAHERKCVAELVDARASVGAHSTQQIARRSNFDLLKKKKKRLYRATAQRPGKA